MCGTIQLGGFQRKDEAEGGMLLGMHKKGAEIDTRWKRSSVRQLTRDQDREICILPVEFHVQTLIVGLIASNET